VVIRLPCIECGRDVEFDDDCLDAACGCEECADASDAVCAECQRKDIEAATADWYSGI
jgi:hypothetical protein